MYAGQRLSSGDWLGLLVVFLLALGTRAWYLAAAADNGFTAAPVAVQGDPLNVAEFGWFGSPAPLSDPEEATAHVPPGYPWLYGLMAGLDEQAAPAMRWLQVALGSLTALCYFLFARRAFQNTLVAFVAGILAAVHPFWIVNAAELNDGVVATFLLAFSLVLGTRGSQEGGAFTSLLFGLSLAGLAMVRAALLPFTVVGLLWFLWCCRSLKLGWFCALLASLGFGNGLAPWTVRNFREFGEPLPVVDAAFLHLWIGNHAGATGGPLDQSAITSHLSPERLQALRDEPNQARRYAMLGRDVVEEIHDHPDEFFTWRLSAGLAFVVGENWMTHKKVAIQTPTATTSAPWIIEHGEAILQGSLLAMLLLGLLGWRLSHGWRRESRLAALAMILVPLPYLLGHAGLLSGPRLPLDGVLLCYSAFALACLWPGTAREPLASE